MSDPPPNTLSFWIDTDPGVDDAIAIILAVRDVGRRIVGMSSVQGNVGETHAARNLARVVAAAGSVGLSPPDWSPLLVRGSRTALTGGPLRADDYVGNTYHGRDGLGDVSWRTPDDHQATPSAAESIVRSARQQSDLCLVCLGPLTNIALALRLAPDLVASVHSVLIMGGSLRAGGNETMAAEFNFAADPEAAAIVLGAGFRNLAIVPIDACDDTRLTYSEHRRLTEIESPASLLVQQLLAGWSEDYFDPHGVGFYDPTAWLLGAEPSLGTWEHLYLTVDTGAGVARGALIADSRQTTGREPNARVATAVPDRDLFYRGFFERLRSAS